MEPETLLWTLSSLLFTHCIAVRQPEWSFHLQSSQCVIKFHARTVKLKDTNFSTDCQYEKFSTLKITLLSEISQSSRHKYIIMYLLEILWGDERLGHSANWTLQGKPERDLCMCETWSRS